MQTRLQQLETFAQQQNVDAVLVTSTANVFYLTGFYCDPKERFLGLLLFSDARKPMIICPNMEMNLARAAGWTEDINGYDDTENPFDKFPSLSSLAIEEEHVTVARLRKLTNTHKNIQTTSIDNELLGMRLQKNEEEIELLQKAAHYADKAVEFGVSALKEGVTELEIIQAIESGLKQEGISKMSFDPVVLFGKNAADPHGSPGTTTLKRGDAVLMDLGVYYKGYASDITRTVFFGEPSKAHQEVYETVLAANVAGINACLVDAPIQDTDHAARSLITEAGYGEYFTHRLGHGLGIEVHEEPSMHGKNSELLQEGMALTVEPGIYLREDIGVRIEDDIIVTNNGPLVLTQYPKSLQIV
ncbi:metallopeptidase [Bacillaceae bacterium JMAK1]|nr:metallopeptidase [Bacillaceae bacterium JMAK1]